MKDYDIVVIGMGAGSIIADAAIAKGGRCAVIENGKFGGTCLNRGCIPTKVIVQAADYARKFEKMRKIGVNGEFLGVDLAKIKSRVWQKIDENKDVRDYYKAQKNVDVYDDTAFFTGKRELELKSSGEKLTGKKIVIASGARTKVPDIKGLEKIDFLTSENIFDDRFPSKPYKSLIVVGGGAIGLEFASMFSAFGSKVSIVQHNVRLSPKSDEDLSQKILEIFKSYGIEVYLNKETPSIEKDGDLIKLTVKDRSTGELSVVTGSDILIAPGVRSNADLLHLENTGVETAKNGYILTNEFLQTTCEGIFAIGDINGKFQLRHKANYEAEVLAHNLFFKKSGSDYRWARYDNVPSVIYTQPEIAFVGLSEQEAVKKGYSVKTAIHHYSQTAKGYAMGYESGDTDDGFVKLIVNADTDEFLGAQAIGDDASLLIQPYIELMNTGNSVIKPVEESIAHGEVNSLRSMPLERYLKPNTLSTTDETMVPHPSLNEVGIWTKYFEWNK